MFTIGLVGLPNAGKSSLFNLITQQSVPAENFPFTTIDPHDAIVAVPDERLSELANINASQKIIPALIEFRDIAGLIKNAHQGEGLGNQFLSHIREVDLIILVVRVFVNDTVIHVENRIHPEEDAEIINIELCLADASLLKGWLERSTKNLKSDPKSTQKIAMVEELYSSVNGLVPARDVGIPSDEDLLELRKNLHLLTDKPILVLANSSYGGVNKEYAADITMDIALEADALGMSSEERIEFDLPLQAPIGTLIGQCYKKLGLSSFLTTGEKETRAWTYVQGSKAPQCAAKIHTDFEKRFVKAEVIKYSDYIEYRSEKKVAELGKKRSEGKEYVMQDGDVVEFILS